MTLISVSKAYSRFCKLMTIAEESSAAGNPGAAVALAQIAARCAFPDHSGLFSSPRLERLLLEQGRRLTTAKTCGARRPSETSRNILHVLTYGRPAGGDTRFVWRWIQEDVGNTHYVAITSQVHMKGVHDIPELLRLVAEKSGGFLRTLNASASKPLDQARELRTLCQQMDIVILHVFPYDIVPVLALAAGCEGVKTLFVNHSDHTFWIGSSVAQSVVHLRTQPTEFLTNRRNLRPGLSPIIPIPLKYSPQSITSTQAKLSLGYQRDAVLLLSIASPFKYISSGQTSFLDLVTPVLLECPEAVLVVVGPQPEGLWLSAKVQTSGRIVPLGSRYDNELLYAAADIYLDSIPFSSITSLLEAGSHGVPLLGLGLSDPEMRLLGPGAPGLEKTMHFADDAAGYRALLTRLIKEPQFRLQSGANVRADIVARHTGGNWTRAVHNLYDSVGASSEGSLMLTNKEAFDSSEFDMAVAALYSHSYDPSHLRKLVRNYVGALPYRSRLSITRRLYRNNLDVSLMNLLPPPANGILRAVGRPAKRIVGRLLKPSNTTRRGKNNPPGLLG